MLLFLNFFKKKNNKTKTVQPKKANQENKSKRKGEIGEYKINIQLDQLPEEYKHLHDLLIENPKSKSGYSQIDHTLITPYGIIVIETKNYQGTIYGGKDRKTWSVNGKFNMMNPFIQNYGHIKAIKNILSPNHHDHFISMVSFTKRCTFKIETDLRDIKADQMIVYDVELSEFIHRKMNVQKLIHKAPLLTSQDIEEIYLQLKDNHISDPLILEKHIHALNNKKKPSCVICHKEVSPKVESYCLSKDKFKGNVYCYDHQKKIAAL